MAGRPRPRPSAPRRGRARIAAARDYPATSPWSAGAGRACVSSPRQTRTAARISAAGVRLAGPAGDLYPPGPDAHVTTDKSAICSVTWTAPRPGRARRCGWGGRLDNRFAQFDLLTCWGGMPRTDRASRAGCAALGAPAEMQATGGAGHDRPFEPLLAAGHRRVIDALGVDRLRSRLRGRAGDGRLTHALRLALGEAAARRSIADASKPGHSAKREVDVASWSLKG